MITHTEIHQLCRKIVERFHPERIILFGSYAYGTPNEDSDVDLLIELPYEGRPVAKATEIRQAVHSGFPLDLLAFPPEYVQQRIQLGDFFFREIVQKGKVLYDTAHQ